MTIKQIQAELVKRQKAIAKERDRLQNLESEVQVLMESCDRACDALTDAIDALSELV